MYCICIEDICFCELVWASFLGYGCICLYMSMCVCFCGLKSLQPMIHLSEKNLIKTLWRTTQDQNHHELPNQYLLSLSVWGSLWVVHRAVLEPRCWYCSDGHRLRAKNLLTKLLAGLIWGHTHAATQRPPQLQQSKLVCVERLCE